MLDAFVDKKQTVRLTRRALAFPIRFRVASTSLLRSIRNVRALWESLHIYTRSLPKAASNESNSSSEQGEAPRVPEHHPTAVIHFNRQASQVAIRTALRKYFIQSNRDRLYGEVR